MPIHYYIAYCYYFFNSLVCILMAKISVGILHNTLYHYNNFSVEVANKFPSGHIKSEVIIIVIHSIELVLW